MSTPSQRSAGPDVGTARPRQFSAAEPLDAMLHRVTWPVAEAMTLPPQVYRDAAIFDLEVEHLFMKEWLLVGRADQIPNPGGYFTCDLFGHKLVITRDEAGSIHCFSRVCLHRGAQIAEGKGQRRLFVCPYHSWSYDLNGRLCAAPHMEPAKDFQPKGEQLPALRYIHF